MLQFLICFMLSYAALVASFMGGGQQALPFICPAIVTVVAVRWFSPTTAAVWAFVLGLMWDSLGTGPLGLHAMTLVAMTALLPLLGFPSDRATAWRWMWAVFVTAWWDGVIVTAADQAPRAHWDALEQHMLQTTLAAAITALALGMWVGLWRQFTGAACRTH